LLNASPLGCDVVGQTLKSKRCASQSQTDGLIFFKGIAIAKIATIARIAEIENFGSGGLTKFNFGNLGNSGNFGNS